ncbi:hypothetical protein BDN71DRAFT_1200634 [Pleurotus eryngii]|uniref:Uncharacterized protein n=1 Tax=Pleurotus eryngii TaxID=5323 RepID=A0A9P5ZS70_PLEER|nr:hypothetical protein BDN71DRAFT_1200634 [Pleurotus eryngii]
MLTRFFPQVALTWSSSTTNSWPTRNMNMLRMWTVVVVGGGGGVGVGVVEQNWVTADPLIQTLQFRGGASCQQACSSIETHLCLLHDDSRDTPSAGAIILPQSRFSHQSTPSSFGTRYLGCPSPACSYRFPACRLQYSITSLVPSTQNLLELLRRSAAMPAMNLKMTQPVCLLSSQRSQLCHRP